MKRYPWWAKALMTIGTLAVVGAIATGITLWVMVRRGFSARDTPSKIEAMMAGAFRRWSVPVAARSRANPVKPTPEALARGREHWADHCALCHANDGSGDTAIAGNLYPKPPDMRTGATQRLSDGELYYVIENGVRLTGMPAWGTGSDDDMETWQLVAFIRHLPALTAAEKTEMTKMNPRSLHEQHEEEDEDRFLNEPTQGDQR